MIGVVLRGGAGARIWPLSRELHPQPFLYKSKSLYHYQIQAVEFEGDRPVMTRAQARQADLPGNDEDESLTFYAAGVLRGEGGDDILTGGGHDELYGGAGNDTLAGGAGNGVRVFRPGEGRDVISNDGGGDDVLRFEALDPLDLWLSQSGDHLLTKLVGAEDQVAVNNWFAAGDYQVDKSRPEAMLFWRAR